MTYQMHCIYNLSFIFTVEFARIMKIKHIKIWRFLEKHIHYTFLHMEKLFSVSISQKFFQGHSLAVQWLVLGAFTSVAWSSIPGLGTKIL